MKIVAKLGTVTFIKLILLVTRELCKIYQTVYSKVNNNPYELFACSYTSIVKLQYNVLQ